jgi:hypothetical protein
VSCSIAVSMEKVGGDIYKVIPESGNLVINRTYFNTSIDLINLELFPTIENFRNLSIRLGFLKVLMELSTLKPSSLLIPYIYIQLPRAQRIILNNIPSVGMIGSSNFIYYKAVIPSQQPSSSTLPLRC